MRDQDMQPSISLGLAKNLRPREMKAETWTRATTCETRTGSIGLKVKSLGMCALQILGRRNYTSFHTSPAVHPRNQMTQLQYLVFC
jgi:hypothetical protein